MSNDDLAAVNRVDFLQRVNRLARSGDFCDLVWVQHLVGEDRGFHPKPPLPSATYYHRYRHWLEQQLLHLCIEAGELADAFRKTGRLDMEEAADVFIVLADLVCDNIDKSQPFYNAVVVKTLRNLTRPERYGLAEIGE